MPAKARLACFALLLALLVFGAVKLAGRARGSREDTFVDNVYVNGVCLSGCTLEEGYDMMEQLTRERMSATYTLTYNGLSWSFVPSDFNAQMDYQSEMERAWNLGHVGDRATRRQILENLKTVPAEFNSPVSYDEAALRAFVDGIGEDIDDEPVDAQVTLTPQKPVITVASRSGHRLDRDQTRENVVALFSTGSGETELPVQVLTPTIASDDMEMNIVAKFTTDVSFRNSASRANVRTALNYFNCFTVNPGDLVSFNQVVGPRTEGAGFNKAPEYAGNDITEGIGGGVCQASTMLYNAAIMANMTIIDRSNHSMTVSYVEPSQDAAVEYGRTDFVFRNDTEYAYYIYTEVGSETATITVYGTRPEYHYQLESVLLSKEKSGRNRYEKDYSGKFVYYATDPPKLKTEGLGSCKSEGWIVAYDWDTKEEVSREKASNDEYYAGYNVYWRGVHDVDGNIIEDEPAE